MCIICVKPAGVEMPDNKTIGTMWQGNSDGAGLAYNRPGEAAVTINKGFMKLKALKGALNELSLGKPDLVILHFRWATHGLTDAGNCHPFPLSNKIEALRAISGQFPMAIAHNGVFGNMACHETLSDTQKFIAEIMCNPAIGGNIENPAIKELIAGYCGTSSKLAILKAGKLLLIGQFEKDESTGLFYSNGGYKAWGRAYTDFPGDDDYFVPNANQIPKICELCYGTENLAYCDAYQLFLCAKCLDYNVSVDNKHNNHLIEN